ncbi:MAG TPA: C25 family cysteine peptidase, partial [Ignavibacteriales bacterium]|nr:C25 family cysteine peptidase [Ignavibacteriales bacterium]
QNDILLKGFLWIGENYCAHIQVNEYRYNINEGSITKIESFAVEFKFVQPLPAKAPPALQKSTQAKIFINSEYASSIKGRPVYKTQSSDDWINYSRTYLKLGVAVDGIYRIYPEDLSASGVNVSFINPKQIKLINNGTEQPIYVSGEDDGSIDADDYIEFIGLRNMGGKHRETSREGGPYNEYLGRYTDTTIYWLSWEGEYGKRASIKDSSAAPAIGELVYYTEVVHKETNKMFDFSMQDEIEKAMPFWSSAKTWNEVSLGVGEKSVEYVLSDVYPNGQARIYSKLQDLASNYYTNAHLLGMTLNADTTVYDKKNINKYEQTVLTGTLNSSLLASGSNILKIHNYNVSGNYINSCAYDWSEIEYPRYIKAVNDSLIFGFPYLNQTGIYKFAVDNFNSSEFSFWKFNLPSKSYVKYNAALAGGRVGITDSISADDRFVIMRNPGIRKPKIYYAKKMKNLRASSNGAEYIAITHTKFKNMAEQYASFISESYSLTAAIVLTDDIYDEFSYGYFDPEAIKDFLMSAYSNWNPIKPEYVCLIGSASYDYYGYKNTVHEYNYVPSYGAPVSDNWFVIWDTTGASYPQMKIGRLPVISEEELNRYFEKHRKYLTRAYTDWNKKYILFSGGRTNLPDELALFKSVNDSLISNYIAARPTGGSYTHFYKTIDPPTNYGPYTNDAFSKIIKEGAIAISYLGHSGAYLWDNGISSPAQLKNDVEGYPLMTDFGCSTAKFAEPDVVSFAVMFTLGTDGQAIQFLGNTSLGLTSTATLFPKIFYDNLLAKNILNTGEALNAGKIDMLKTYGELGTYKLFAYTNTIIGDPVINIKIPQKPNLVINSGNISIEPSAPKNSDDSILVKAEYFNYGSSPNNDMLIKAEYLINGNVERTLEFSKALPLISDSLAFYLPLNKTAGEGEIRITLDARSETDELNENDNLASLSFYVVSSRLQSDLQYDNVQEISGRIRIFNPSVKPASEIMEYEISDAPNFAGAQKYFKRLDTLYTDIHLDPFAFPNGRYWFRAKLQGETEYSINKSFYMGTSDGFLMNDSISLAASELHNTHFDNGIILDTPFTSGSLVTPFVGPIGKWSYLEAEVATNTGSIDVIPIVYNKSGAVDTLPGFELTSGQHDLSGYNPKYYKAKFIVNMHRGNGGAAPVLRSLKAVYAKPAELYMNYQTVTLSADTVKQGGYINLQAVLYNAGETPADSVKVNIDVLNSSNIIEESRTEYFDSIAAGGKKEIQYSYYSRKSGGEKRFRISIDKDNGVKELIDDNNIYSAYFYVLADTGRPVVRINFDGKEVYDNEYVSAEPEIVVELYGDSFMEINDTTVMNIYLDGKRMNYSGPDGIAITYNINNPKAVARLLPRLEEGAHTINISVKNSAGNYVSPENSQKKFLVLKSVKMLDIYNYPNPASDETYFTFRLTQLPDIIKIKIYTIAGRMIKEIKIDKSQLSMDFNKIYWDCRDKDGDKISSGAYLYKIIWTEKGKSSGALGKMGIIR